MAVNLARHERVWLHDRPHFTGTVMARRGGNVDVRWDADGCTTTVRQWRLRRIEDGEQP